MAQLLGISKEQVTLICPLFPKERGGKRVDDRKVLRGGAPRLIGGTKGGMASKLNGVCHSKGGGPLRLHLNEGQCSDFTSADVLCKDLPPAATVMGDQGYDRDKIRKMLSQQGIMPCIPPRRCRKKPVHYSKRLDRKGHKIETLFSRTEGLAAHCNPLRRLRPRPPFCHPPGRHCPLLVMSSDPG